MQSKAATVKEYIASLPPDRRAEIEKVRKVIRDSLDKGYAEGMQYGMIAWNVPHSTFPAGYHCDPRQPLPFAGLASQKHHLSLYVYVYMDPAEEKRFRAAWARTRKKLDMGKCCIRFKKADDIALDVIADSFRRMPVKKYIALYQSNLGAAAAAKSTGKSASKPAPKKPAAKKKAPAAKKKAPARRKPARV